MCEEAVRKSYGEDPNLDLSSRPITTASPVSHAFRLSAVLAGISRLQPSAPYVRLEGSRHSDSTYLDTLVSGSNTGPAWVVEVGMSCIFFSPWPEDKTSSRVAG